MKIGYDAKRFFTNFTGLGNYSRTLVNNYHLAYPADELILFTPSIADDVRTTPFIENKSYGIIQPQGWKPFWRSTDIVKDIDHAGVEIYHGLSHELPLGISKLDIGKVVTIHDLIFKYFQKDYNWLDRRIYDMKWKHSCAASDVIIAISHQTKNDLVNYYNIDERKIKVIYQPADRSFSERVSDEDFLHVKHKYNLPGKYNLYVGSLISRKNLMLIIKAMQSQKKGDRLPLVIIGQGESYKKLVNVEAQNGGIENLLIWLGGPSFKDFPALYKGASMMIYPSLHEGFGLPVIEAMHVGIPVITSNQSSLKEAGGEAAKLLDPNNAAELSDAMHQIVSDPGTAQEMVARGFEHVKKFSAAHAASSLNEVYKRIIR